MSRTRREIELLVEALDDVPLSDDDAAETVQRLGIDTKAWAEAIRKDIAAADALDRAAGFETARRAYEAELASYGERSSEPRRSVGEQRDVLKGLMARIPRESAASMHFHKFEEASSDELAELIKALRHMLGEDADE